jgi:periplasmic divalent cation tolerance protein
VAPRGITAARIARVLVEERLAACVQSLAGVHSTYRWQGTLHTDAEVLLLIKTTRARLPALMTRLPFLHPYDTPELLVVEVVDGLPPYLDWLDSATASP